MNLANLINRQIIESRYENKKELYEDMKEIIGPGCCAYNTFTEALRKNMSLSDVELLTLATLLDIDLNKLAMHYVKSRKYIEGNVNVDEYVKENLDAIFLYISFIVKDDYPGSRLDALSRFAIDDKYYFLVYKKDYNYLACYEITVKKSNDKYILKTSEIAKFYYFREILSLRGMTIDTFRNLNHQDMIALLKEEGDIYYELFSERKSNLDEINLDDFKLTIAEELIQEYISNQSGPIIRYKDFIVVDNDVCDESKLEEILKDMLYERNLCAKGLLDISDKAYSIFEQKVSEKYPICSLDEEKNIYGKNEEIDLEIEI